VGALEELGVRYGDEVAFYVVYIREAHPEDGWILQENRNEEIALRDPTSLAERADVADTRAARLALTLPVVVDGPDDAIARAYGGWPDRLYLVDRGGRIAYQGGPGPFGFLPEELEQAIDRELRAA
jgi:hypothetical protein